jgi:hypothetical protein
MKGTLKTKQSQLFVNHLEYPIIGKREDNYGYESNGVCFLICDDYCNLHLISEKLIMITNADQSNFVNINNHLRYENLKIDKAFISIINKSLTNDEVLEFQSNIWSEVWLIKSLINFGFDVGSNSIEIMNDENYKTNLITGFLEATNEFINFDCVGSETLEIKFDKEDKEKSFLRFEKENMTPIIENSEEIVIDKIKNFMFKYKDIIVKNENLSKKLSRKLFLLIDCIFVDENQKIFTFDNGYKSEMIIFEYNSFYYQLVLCESD